jgi:hypothetical protein
MYASYSIQRVRITEASVMDDLQSVLFHIKFTSTEPLHGAFVSGEVCFHLENVSLGLALVKAINEVLAAHAPKAETKSEPTSDDPADDEIAF